MSETDRLLRNAGHAAATDGQRELPAAPAKRVAIVACMDARLNLFDLLGLRAGDAHIIRNAGGVVTSDVMRSLAISQRLLGTNEIVLIHHTECGMLGLDEDEFRGRIKGESGIEPDWAVEAFDDLDDDVRESIARIHASPFIPHTQSVRGFVYDVGRRTLREVAASHPGADD